MIKSMKIGKKNYALKANADTPRIYRDMFGRDIFVDMDTVISGNDTDSDKIPVVVRIAFTMAFQAGSPLTLLTDWATAAKKEIQISDFVFAAMELWRCNLATMRTETDSTENSSLTTDSTQLTTAKYLKSCINAGIGICDLRLLTIGMIVDIFREFQGNTEEQKPVIASQHDFDTF